MHGARLLAVAPESVHGFPALLTALLICQGFGEVE